MKMNGRVVGKYKRFIFCVDFYCNHDANGMQICFFIRLIVRVNMELTK